jgi:hypothetical protein
MDDSPDAGIIPCGDVTFHGECQGNVLRYCFQGSLVEEDCAAPFNNSGTCDFLGDESGHHCVVAPGGDCDDPRPTSFSALLCGGSEGGCVTLSGGSICQEGQSACEGSEVGSCRGDSFLAACQETQPWLLDCADLGGQCADAQGCVDLGPGATCEGPLRCADGLTCTEGVCDSASGIDGGTPPSATDGGGDSNQDGG